MPRVTKTSFYAVHRGYNPGIYLSWADCEQQIKGYPKAVHKKFSTEAEAKAFVEGGFSAGTVAAVAGSTAQLTANLSSTGVATVDKTTYLSKKFGRNTHLSDESGWDVVYTDGSSRGNGKKGAIAGIGVWWGVNDPRNLTERCPGEQTNNRAELIAIIRVLETAPHRRTPLLIKTDSSYSIRCLRDWISTWRRRHWKTADGKDVKNKAVIMYLADLLEQRFQSGQRVHLQHVRGHDGIEGNVGADKLARFGATLPMKPEREWSYFREYAQAGDQGGMASYELDESDILSAEELRREVETASNDLRPWE